MAKLQTKDLKADKLKEVSSPGTVSAKVREVEDFVTDSTTYLYPASAALLANPPPVGNPLMVNPVGASEAVVTAEIAAIPGSNIEYIITILVVSTSNTIWSLFDDPNTTNIQGGVDWTPGGTVNADAAAIGAAMAAFVGWTVTDITNNVITISRDAAGAENGDPQGPRIENNDDPGGHANQVLNNAGANPVAAGFRSLYLGQFVGIKDDKVRIKKPMVETLIANGAVVKFADINPKDGTSFGHVTTGDGSQWATHLALEAANDGEPFQALHQLNFYGA